MGREGGGKGDNLVGDQNTFTIYKYADRIWFSDGNRNLSNELTLGRNLEEKRRKGGENASCPRVKIKMFNELLFRVVPKNEDLI